MLPFRILTAIAIFSVGVPAQADLIISMSSGADTVIIADGVISGGLVGAISSFATDSDGSDQAGLLIPNQSISSGSFYVGGWRILASDVVGTNFTGDLKLDLQLTASAIFDTGNLSVQITETDIDQGGVKEFTSSIGGVLSGTSMNYESGYSNTNDPFAFTQSITGSGITGTFDQQQTIVANDETDPYSLSQTYSIAYSDGATVTFDSELQVTANSDIDPASSVPEPSPVFVLGVLAVGAVVYRRRKQALAHDPMTDAETFGPP